MQLNLNDFFWFGFTNQKFNFIEGINNYNLKASALIEGRSVPLDKAIEKLLEIFEKTNSVHFDGLICDQKSLTRILDLAERKRSSVNHVEADDNNNFFTAYQKYGGSFVSFNELRKRSDLLIFLGNFENNQIKSFINNTGWRKNFIENSIFLFSRIKSSKLKNQFNYGELNNIAKTMINLFNNEPIEKKYQKLKKKVNDSKYPVIVINTKNGFIITDQILKACENINNSLKKIRIFRFSGLNNSSGFINSSLTKTGYPGAINFTDWGVFHNPAEYSAKIQKKLVSTQIYFSNLNSNPDFVKFKKNVFVGHPNFKHKKEFDVFIPVKTPGLDTNGLVVRSDGIGLLKLKKRMESDYIGISKLVDLLMFKNG